MLAKIASENDFYIFFGFFLHTKHTFPLGPFPSMLMILLMGKVSEKSVAVNISAIVWEMQPSQK